MPRRTAPDGLTGREVEVLRLIAKGLSNTEIAGRLFVAESTVKTHINNAFAEIGARNRADAVRYRHRLTDPCAPPHRPVAASRHTPTGPLRLDGCVDVSPYTDLERPPLREDALRRALIRPDSLWREIRVVAQTGSTNADLAAAARTGAPEGEVLVAEWQSAGRGRLTRAWVSPPRAALTFSLLVRPEVAPTRLGWLPLLTGVAVVAALRRLAAVAAVLKWPNDVLVGERKLAGILAEQPGHHRPGEGSGPERPGRPKRRDLPGAVVVGVGLNVTNRAAELPGPAATSLAMEDADCLDRDPLLRALLREFAVAYGRWRGHDGDPDASGIRPAYRQHCATLGRRVRVALPGGDRVEGTAVDVDVHGRLVVATPAGERALSAGEVVHLRAPG